MEDLRNQTFAIKPIGHVNATKETFSIQIFEDHRKGLHLMDKFSHFLVFWWANGHDNDQSRSTLETQLFYADGLTAGVFACRSEFRPNPVAVTICTIIDMDVDSGLITVPYMDAFDKTPVIDLKPYFPVSDRVNKTRVPDWVKEWPQCYEQAYKLEALFASFEES